MKFKEYRADLFSTWDKLFIEKGKFKMERGIYSFVNPYSMTQISGIEVDKIDNWLVDGVSLVSFLNKFSSKYGNIIRYSFDETSLSPVIFKFAKENNMKIGLVGTEQRYLINAVKILEEKYDINISYCRNGFFHSDRELIETCETIIDEAVDIIICGMGTPNQENFLIQLKGLGWKGYGFTCGGFIHQTSYNLNYYPNWINNLNLRSIYRIYREPKLFKRYALYYSWFYFLYATYLFKNKLIKNIYLTD